jgi:hypothetical protein
VCVRVCVRLADLPLRDLRSDLCVQFVCYRIESSYKGRLSIVVSVRFQLVHFVYVEPTCHSETSAIRSHVDGTRP